uniref:Uncharacterized protein n=1 Tax=Arundo donax TaxID=35708 RepID=A0A0A9BU04_ARUDO
MYISHQLRWLSFFEFLLWSGPKLIHLNQKKVQRLLCRTSPSNEKRINI